MIDKKNPEELKTEAANEFALDDDALDNVAGGMQLSINLLNELQQAIDKYPALQEILNNRESIMRFISDATYRNEVFAKAKNSLQDSDFLQNLFL